MDQQMGGGQKMMCGCPHHKAVPILIILFGLLFLLGSWNIVSASMVTMGWPIIIILIGLTKLMKAKCGCCSNKY